MNRIEEIPADIWNRVFPDIPEGYNFYKSLDKSGFDQFSFRYILVYERRTVVGATVCFLMSYSLDTTINGPLRRVTNYIKKLSPNLFSIKTLACGMPMGQGQIGATVDADRIVKAISRRMEQIARKEKAAILAFKDFNQSYTKILDPLQKEGFSKFDSLPTTEMNVWFKDFEEYLKTLSAATRYDLRRKFKRTEALAKVDFEVLDKLDDDMMADIHRLYLQVVDKHDMGFEILPVDFFRIISENMPRNVKFFLWRIDKKLVAFLFCLLSEDFLIDYYVGLDYSVAHKYHLYFIKFRDVMNWAIMHKIKRYEMGITGYEPKKRLGFDFIPLYLYVKLRNRMLRPVFRFFCQFLKFENFDPVLKKAKREGKNVL